MANTLTYRTVVAGIEVQVRNEKTLGILFTRLGGKASDVSDKGLTMTFPTAAARTEFATAAKANGAIIE